MPERGSAVARKRPPLFAELVVRPLDAAQPDALLRWPDPERYDDVRTRISVACLQAVRYATEDDALLRVAEWMFLFRDRGGLNDLYD
ncbi:hypothetical protein SAMN05216188_110153 [Lentzea xinjiangensis]|uniref:Uncharacterized protein n=1 Tax=Lentzea xinjiangensis TaxID=402600 RepID=A0A1H9NDI5_9PSEU|nr:hypothetical protein [Lentzea xinjiangensis]SER34014.1 hypothetical protein SAMN05216188_110153 [Lentzea xinjiangensis]